MSFMRNFILKQSLYIEKEFEQNVLSKFRPPFHIYCKDNKSNFTYFKGNDLKEFVTNVSNFPMFILNILVSSNETENLLGNLKVLPSFFEFILVSKIIDEQIY